ncbi:MAG: hypothetical protein HRF49_06370 [bacterium]|jgi:hypothetical protein
MTQGAVSPKLAALRKAESEGGNPALGFVLLAAGLLIQVVFMHLVSWVIGLALVLTASILLLPKGASNAPKSKSRSKLEFDTNDGTKPFKAGDWEELDPAKLPALKKLVQQSRKVGSAGLGGCYWVIVGICAFGWFMSAGFNEGGGLNPAVTFVLSNLIAFFIPQAGGGGVTAWRPELLDIKLGVFENVYPIVSNDPTLSVKLQAKYYSEVGGDRKIPYDLQLKANFKDAPKELYGVQFQVSLNSVQGTNYPYFYAVIVADRSYNLKQKMAGLRAPGRDITEYKNEKDVSICVIRQDPDSGKTGYHTDKGDQMRIAASALNMFERLRPKG